MKSKLGTTIGFLFLKIENINNFCIKNRNSYTKNICLPYILKQYFLKIITFLIHCHMLCPNVKYVIFLIKIWMKKLM